MKNYDELTQDLLARRDRYVAEQKKKRKTVAASLCCVCFVALLGFGLWKSGLFSSQPPITLADSTIIGEKDYINPDELNNNSQTSTPNNNDSSVQNDPARIMWTVNRVESRISAAKLNFSSDKYYSEKKTLADVTAYLGKDLSTLEAVLPQGFEFSGRYETDFFYKLNGELAYDSCVFGYKKDNQQITIQASKLGVPYDCLYMMDNSTPSNIGGVEIVIGGIYSDTNSEQLDLVFADFSHNGIQYRIEVENIPFDGTKDALGWLADILAELIK